MYKKEVKTERKGGETKQNCKAFMSLNELKTSLNEKIIKLVEKYPIIWSNRSCNGPCPRREAWERICNSLDPNYKNLNLTQQTLMVATVKQRWRNIKNSYLRSLRQNPGKSGYLYKHQLRFLDLELNGSEDEADEAYEADETSNIQSVENTNQIDRLTTDHNIENRKNDSDSDMEFFRSILNHVKGLTEEEKLEFRFGVLGMIKTIKNNRKTNSNNK